MPNTGSQLLRQSQRCEIIYFTNKATRRRDQTSAGLSQLTLIAFGCSAIIGGKARECIKKQLVLFSVTVPRQQRCASRGGSTFPGLSTSIHKVCITASLQSQPYYIDIGFLGPRYLTVDSEALASTVGCRVLEYTKDPNDNISGCLSETKRFPRGVRSTTRR